VTASSVSLTPFEESLLVEPDTQRGEGGPVRRHLARRGTLYASILLLPAFIALWQVLTSTGFIHPILLPPPLEVVEATAELVTAPTFFDHFGRTISEIAIGYGLGVAIGFALGVALSSFPLLRRAYFPLLAGFEAIPGIVLAPIVITWFGFGIESKIVQAVIACFFPVFITTLAGLAMSSDDEIKLMRSLLSSRWQIFRKLRLPNALPAIFGGLKIAITTAIIGAVVSEFVAADKGLGFLLLRYKASFETATVFSLIVMFAIIGTASFLLIEYLERRLIYWRGSRA